MAELKGVIKRIENNFKGYEKERNNEEGMIDLALACGLADSIPYLIEQLEYYKEEADDQTKWADAYFKELQTYKAMYEEKKEENERLKRVIKSNVHVIDENF